MPKPRLRLYEDLMLLILARSPRIARITVQLDDDAYPEDGEDDELDDPEFDFVPLLEHLYRSPSAEKE